MKRLSKSDLKRLVAKATAGAHDEIEQLAEFFTILGNDLAYPFRAILLGAPAAVIDVEVAERPDLVFVCLRGRERLRVRVMDLPRPSPVPEGWEWVEAYRYWADGS
ncbi:MAG: hypothetical protein AAB074_02410 [Planctomycetota bacterium]